MNIFFFLSLIFACSCAFVHDEEHLLDCVRANDIKAVSSLIGLDLVRDEATEQPSEDEPALKRRRLLPEEHPMDPSFDDNLLVFEALESNLSDMVKLLLSHPLVQETLDVYEFIQSAIEHHLNEFALEYLKAPCTEDQLESHFIKAFISNNVEVLKDLFADDRVDLNVVVLEALKELNIESKCKDTILFLMDSPVPFDTCCLLDWSCYNWNIGLTTRIFSDLHFHLDIDRVKQSMLGGGLEMAILLMAQPGADIEGIRDELLVDEFDVVGTAEQMTWCLATAPYLMQSEVQTVEEVAEDEPTGESKEVTQEDISMNIDEITEDSEDVVVNGAKMAIACFHFDIEKVKALLPLKLDSDMLCLLVSAMTAYHQSDILNLLVHQNIGKIGIVGLNGILEGRVYECSIVHVVYTALCKLDTDFSEIQSKIRLYDATVEEEGTIQWLTDRSNSYNAQSLEGVAGLISIVKSHIIAMTAISAHQYLPSEIKDYILYKSFSNLPSYISDSYTSDSSQ